MTGDVIGFMKPSSLDTSGCILTCTNSFTQKKTCENQTK